MMKYSYYGAKVNDLRHGIGTLKRGTYTYEGMWERDMKHGHGKESDTTFEYEGGFFDSKRVFNYFKSIF